MIKHIVMWTLRDSAEGRSKEENARLLKTKLESLAESIPQIQHLEVGLNFNPSEAACDVVLVTEFADRQSLQVYQDHPEHRNVVVFLEKVRLEKKVVDYETP